MHRFAILVVLACFASVVQAQEKPPDQLRFEEIIQKWRNAYANADDFERWDMRAKRAADIAKYSEEKNTNHPQKEADMENWIGTVGDVFPTIDKGDAYLSVRTTPYIQFWTVADMEIKRGTDLYKIVSKLKPGDKVRFSGFVTVGEKDFYKETSLTDAGSIEAPDFYFDFDKVEPLGQ